MKFMSNLRNLRIKKGYTQAKLGELACISKRTVEKYETGERDINGAKAIIVWKLSKVLDCEMVDIMEGVKDETKENHGN